MASNPTVVIATRVSPEVRTLFEQVIEDICQELGCRLTQSQVMELLIRKEARARNLTE